MNEELKEELISALAGTVTLIELWIDGPLKRIGILWQRESDLPPALLRAKKLLEEINEQS